MILYTKINNPKRVYINESKILSLEGVDWSKTDDGKISMSINQNKDNNSNKGTNSVDTRVFGTKDDILHGKMLSKTGKPLGTSKSLEQDYNSKSAAINAYKTVINWINGGRVGECKLPEGLDKVTETAINRWLSSRFSDNRVIDLCKKSITRIESDYNRLSMTRNRISNSDNVYKMVIDWVKGGRIGELVLPDNLDQATRVTINKWVTSLPNDKIIDLCNKSMNKDVARYITGIVPNTNVKYISLFSMTDFNFSDAIKHGTVRQNGNTDDILGIGEKDREVDQNGNLKTLDIMYDKTIQPNVAQNFSLNGVKDGHFKQQYGLNGGGAYSSVAQFLDKSVNYAAYALRKENFSPDFIVSAPSSSSFNEYYCRNLSNKLGIRYINDFFKRNVINVRYADGQDLLSKGFSPKDVLEFESQAKNIAYNEIGYMVSEPIRKFIYNNENVFGTISIERSSREKFSLNEVFDCVMIYAYNTILENMNDGDNVSSHLVKNFLKEKKKLYSKQYDSKRIFNEVVFRIKTKIGIKVFNSLLMETMNLVLKYSDILKNNGYKLRFNIKKFKITSFKKMFRPFLSNLYIIADEYMSNGELMNRFKNAKFLIFDEDINSGATLKIVIDALEEKLPEQNSSNLLCLVNAYSNSGF